MGSVGSNRYQRAALQFCPVGIAGLFVALLWFSPTRKFAKSLLLENQIVELTTFAAFLLGAVLGFVLALRLKRSGQHPYVAGFYALACVAMFIMAMEEADWGQVFFGFDTPTVLKELMKLREMSLHKRHLIDGQSEYLRMIASLGALLGLLLWRFPLFRKIAMPPVLWPWPFVITILSGIDMYTVYFPVPKYFYRTMGIYMSEVIEMLIGLAAFLYVAVNLRRLSGIENRPQPSRT